MKIIYFLYHLGEVSDTIIEDSEAIDEERPQKRQQQKKIHRPCPFCLKMQSALTRHLTKSHKNEPDVAKALGSSRQMRIRLFAELRKKGIHSYNKKEMGKSEPKYIR